MRKITAYLSAKGATLEELDAAFQDKIDVLLGGVTPILQEEGPNSSVRVGEFDGVELFQADRNYELVLPD